SSVFRMIFQPGTPSEMLGHLRRDMFREDKRRPATIRLDRLDEPKMFAMLEQMKDERYHLADNNCATFAARLLEEGASQAPSFTPKVHLPDYLPVDGKMGTIATHLIERHAGGPLKSWTPEQLLAFAAELQQAEAQRNLPPSPPHLPDGQRGLST